MRAGTTLELRTRLAFLITASAVGGCATHRQASPIKQDGARHYRCTKASQAIRIDGKLDEPIWSLESSTGRFVDIRADSAAPARYRTRCWMRWDEDFLYVAARLAEPNVRARLKERDSIIYHDNDFEVFIDPDGDGLNYMEFEINALGTVFDLMLDRPYRQGGKAKIDWNVSGLRAAVHVDGTLNDDADTDKGWSVEMAIPWEALCEHAKVTCPPRAGDVWRMNFSRVQWPDDMMGGSAELSHKGIEGNWVWAPQGEVDMHIPDRWGFVQFVEE